MWRVVFATLISAQERNDPSCRESLRMAKSYLKELEQGCPNVNQWTPRYGQLMTMPFGISDFHLQNLNAEQMWERRTVDDREERFIMRGYDTVKDGHRCAEMRKVHPVGHEGEPWTSSIAQEAKDWCDNNPDCVGLMRYIGNNPGSCYVWCGRPQFCMKGEEEVNPDWRVFYKNEVTA